jgi:hypothetical protein
MVFLLLDAAFFRRDHMRNEALPVAYVTDPIDNIIFNYNLKYSNKKIDERRFKNENLVIGSGA